MSATLLAIAMNPHLSADAVISLTQEHFKQQIRRIELATEYMKQLPDVESRLRYAQIALPFLLAF